MATLREGLSGYHKFTPSAQGLLEVSGVAAKLWFQSGKSRIAFISELRSHWLWKVVAAMWGALGVTEVVLPFCPQKWSDAFYALGFLPHWHWYIWVIGLLLLASIATFEGGHHAWRQASEAEGDTTAILEPIQIELSPSTGQADTMLLALTNLGKAQTFHAQCRPIAIRNDPNQLRSLTFDLVWEQLGTVDMLLKRGQVGNLLLATAEDNAAEGLEYIKLWGLSGGKRECIDWRRWPREQRQNLPEYDLKVTIFGGASEPHEEIFTLRPGKHSALEIVSPRSLSGGQLRESDPRLYLSVEDGTRQYGDNIYHLLLHNIGGQPAHRVHIEAPNHIGKLVFKDIDTVPSGKPFDITPLIVGVGQMEEHDLLGASIRWWDKENKLNEEYPVRIRISYEDHSGQRKLQSEMTLILFPIKLSMVRRHLSPLSIPNDWTLAEVRDTTFAVLN